MVASVHINIIFGSYIWGEIKTWSGLKT